jgi:hypothetical protein
MTIPGVKTLSDRESVIAIEKYVHELLAGNIYTKANPYWNGSEFLAYKNYLVTVGNAVANTKGLELGGVYTALKAMNPGPIGTGKIWNPASIFGGPPGSLGRITDNADIPRASSNPGSENALRNDRLNKEVRKSQQTSNENLNMYDKENKFYEKQYVNNGNPESLGQAGMKTVSPVPGVQYSVPDYSAFFDKKSMGPEFGDGPKATDYYIPRKGSRASVLSKNWQHKKNIENDDSFFAAGDLTDGYITLNDGADALTDSTNYMPFFLEDMRSGGKRIYFRAFFKNFRESISPEWAQEKYFGRVDPVGIYMGTSRTISVSFSVVAMSPAGFTAMWRKLNQLTKLLYPTFRNGVMYKSPVSRMRIGDVICDDSGRGLTGYISSPIELDYSDSVWEISEYTGYKPNREMGKAPMMAVVSFTFQVIHEESPKIDTDFNFDTSFFRRIGKLQESAQAESASDEGTEEAGVTPVTSEGSR